MRQRECVRTRRAIATSHAREQCTRTSSPCLARALRVGLCTPAVKAKAGVPLFAPTESSIASCTAGVNGLVAGGLCTDGAIVAAGVGPPAGDAGLDVAASGAVVVDVLVLVVDVGLGCA